MVLKLWTIYFMAAVLILITTKMKNKKYHNSKVKWSKSQKEEKYTNAQMHVRSLCWFGSGISTNNGGMKLVVWAQTSTFSEIMRLYKCFPHMNKMPLLTYKRTNNVIINQITLLLNIYKHVCDKYKQTNNCMYEKEQT
jgi:hypothetical protein